ncbi:MAG: Gfo/Idh/MocA family oxidoreductase [Deltaproteobacteria bacterium]|nr:Gfo/Idh/MocA family oxidoreductase [Deltaproteobacteria bacterium]
MRNTRVGILGSGSIAQNHFEAFARVAGVGVVAVASPTEANVRAFARRNGIPRWFTDWRKLADLPDVHVVSIGSPNFLHAAQAIACLGAGKHVICEKPLCLTLEEADAIIAAEKRNCKTLFYAENLCFVPKAVRFKEIVDAGGVGKPYLVKEWEKHAGPYSPWFFRREQAGGGAMMDMGCHAIEFCRWFMGKPRVRSVFAHCGLYLHEKITKLDDNIVVIMEFENGAIAHVEASWALKGGMDSVAECCGTEGAICADLYRGTGIRCFSERGYSSGGQRRQGWHTPEYDTRFEHGYVGEMAHFVECIRTGGKPTEGTEDGRAVLEIMLAAYHSAGTGKRVALPFRPEGVEYPVDLWLKARATNRRPRVPRTSEGLSVCDGTPASRDVRCQRQSDAFAR